MYDARRIGFRGLLLCGLVLAGIGCAHLGQRTALDDYVAKPDSSYTFSQAGEPIAGEGYKAFVLDMTSQQWRTAEEIDKPLWKHWLIVVKPDQVASNKALLFVNGGSNDKPIPTSVSEELATIAVKTKSIVANLTVVPNEPVVFTEEGKPRSEDEIIAYSFDKYMATGDDTWPLLLPMAKSAVRAMDTVQAFMKDAAVPVDQFVVSGGSKRGWTTWLTAAVDERVVAIIPAVIDVLNMDEQMAHHYGAYGFYAPSVQDYVDKNIFDRFDTRAGQRLLKIVDPYEYRNRYTIPKYLVNSAGDQFFLPDSAQFYYYDLPGPKYIRYVPNTDHGLGESDAWESVMSFYASVVNDATLPRFTWTVEKPCTMRIVPQDKPVEVNLWQAVAPDSRDFRLETLGAKWTSSPLSPEANGDYIAAVKAPQKGWVAYFAELVYDSGMGVPYKFTTEVRVIPTALPFAESATYGRSPQKKQRRQPMKPCPCPSW